MPAPGKVWIDVTANQTGDITIMVFDLAGKMVRQQSASCIKGELIVRSIDLTNLAAGLYQVKVVLPDQTFLTGQFIRQ